MGFLGLDIALSGLRAQQQAMDVTAHNIANANTRGYHRQEAHIIPGNPLTGAFAMTGVGSPQLGTGAMVTSVRRMQSTYVDQQVRTAGSQLAEWDYRKGELAQVESIFAEPGDLGLASAMDRFWNSWEELSASPESQSARISVVETGVTLSQRIKALYQDLVGQQTQADQDIADNASEINRLASEIANINVQIKRSMANGYQPNDLMDYRDTLIDELSSIAAVQISGGTSSDLILAISGRTLVQGDLVNEVSVTQNAQGWSVIQWSEDGAPVQIKGGQLAGQFVTRDQTIQSYVDALDELARSLVTEVNSIYGTGRYADGSPAGDFFAPGSGASDIDVVAALVSNPSILVTSTAGTAGGNDVAQSIANLNARKLASGETLNESYLRLVAQVGADSRETIARSDTYASMLEQLNAQRESISGVSMDEEMLNMAKFQQAYNASARMATVMDEMIDTIVNRLGVVGR